VPVVLVSARDGTGLDALERELARHERHLAESGRLAARRRAGRDAFVRRALRERYGSHGLDAIGGPDCLPARLAAEPEATGFGLAAELGSEIEEALRKPPTGATR
jgi:GNAT superfamily N-acetyltransferase